MNDIMEIIKFLEDSSLLIKGVSKTITNETKEQKGRSLFKADLNLTLFIQEIIYLN